MSLTITTSRSELLAQARHEWSTSQQQKAVSQAKTQKSEPQPPPDEVLISEDAVLRQEIQKLEQQTDQLLTAAASGTRVNVVG